jgi:hypothetical protein
VADRPSEQAASLNPGGWGGGWQRSCIKEEEKERLKMILTVGPHTSEVGERGREGKMVHTEYDSLLYACKWA